MPSVDFFGESFRLVDEPSEWAMLEFASIAGGTDSSELAGLAAIMRLLEASVDEADWERFKTVARKNKAKIERDLMPVVVAVFQGETERPTPPPSDSSAGRPATAPNSTVAFSPAVPPRPVGDRYDQMIQELNGEGRPDLALFVRDAQRHSTV